MNRRFELGLLLSLFIFALAAHAQPAKPLWRQLPPTPTLPEPESSGMAPVNDILIYFAMFGQGKPVILLHGGLANSNYWANQVPALAQHYRVIVADSRGHGRSTRSAKSFSYELMASDIVGLMDYLKIPKAAVIGWSDGAIIGLELAIHNPNRLTGLFAFGANYNPMGLRANFDNDPTFKAYLDRTRTEYERLSSTPAHYDDFLAAIGEMWAKEPNIFEDQLRRIKVPVLIADGDHDELIRIEHTVEMAALIPGAGLLIQPQVSHFAMLQDSLQFNQNVLHFLAQVGK